MRMLKFIDSCTFYTMDLYSNLHFQIALFGSNKLLLTAKNCEPTALYWFHLEKSSADLYPNPLKLKL